MGVTREVA